MEETSMTNGDSIGLTCMLIMILMLCKLVLIYCSPCRKLNKIAKPIASAIISIIDMVYFCCMIFVVPFGNRWYFNLIFIGINIVMVFVILYTFYSTDKYSLGGDKCGL